MPQPGRIVVAEPVSPIVAMPAVLCIAGFGLELTGVGTKTKVAPADAHAVDLPAAVAIRAVNPAIESPLETVHAVLLISGLEAGEQHGALIAFVVAVGGAEEKDVGSGGDDDPVAPWVQAGGKGE